MKLSGPQFQQIQEALLDAYTEFGLRQMLRVQMDVDLDSVVGSGGLERRIHDLIQWAETQDQVERLIRSAYLGNQTNVRLKNLLANSAIWFIDQSDSFSPLDNPTPTVSWRPSHQVDQTQYPHNSIRRKSNWIIIFAALIALVGSLAIAYATFSGGERGAAVLKMTATSAGALRTAQPQVTFGATESPPFEATEEIVSAESALETESATEAPSPALNPTPINLPASTPPPTATSTPTPEATAMPTGTSTSTTVPEWTNTPEAALQSQPNPEDTSAIDPSLLPSDPTDLESPGSESALDRNWEQALTLAEQLGLKQESVRIDPKIGSPFILVPGGEFVMGAVGGPDDQEPARQIYLDSYAIKLTEVTNAEYGQCVDARVCLPPNNDRWNKPAYADHPVVNVTWSDADAYASWIGGRLPSEAQWERACRGENAQLYPWGDADPSRVVGNFDNRIGDTAAVLTTMVAMASNDVSSYGVRDMAGGVREWVDDWYSRFYYGQMPAYNPGGPDSTRKHTIRGGAYDDHTLISCVVRHSAHTERIMTPGETSYEAANVGFRVVLSVTSE